MTDATASALTDDQAAYVSGLVDLAGWLSNNPDAIPDYIDHQVLLALLTNGAVEEFAARHGLKVVYDDEGDASVSVRFGPIKFYAYGYLVDFAERYAQRRRSAVEKFAAEHGLALVPAETGGGARS